MENKEQIRVAVNSGRFIEKDELEAMPLAEVVMTHERVPQRKTGVVSHRWTAAVEIHPYVLSPLFVVTQAQFGLAMLQEGKAFIPDQARIRRHARLVKVDFPASEGKEARTAYCLEVYLVPGQVTLTRWLDDDSSALVEALLAKKQLPANWAPYVRDAKQGETVAAEADPQ